MVACVLSPLHCGSNLALRCFVISEGKHTAAFCMRCIGGSGMSVAAVLLVYEFYLEHLCWCCGLSWNQVAWSFDELDVVDTPVSG